MILKFCAASEEAALQRQDKLRSSGVAERQLSII